MDQYEHIRTAHRVYGQSISDIARTTGHSRNTIRKALSGQYSGYSPRQQQTYPVLGSFTDIIDGWLRNDRDRSPKQRKRALFKQIQIVVGIELPPPNDFSTAFLTGPEKAGPFTGVLVSFCRPSKLRYST
jgi:hypothetical protein